MSDQIVQKLLADVISNEAEAIINGIKIDPMLKAQLDLEDGMIEAGKARYWELVEKATGKAERGAESTPARAAILGVETGARLGELVLSVKGAWNLEARVFSISSELAKSGRARPITLTSRAVEAVKPWLDACASPALRPFQIDKSTVCRRMRKARTYLKMESQPHFCFHATRHTRATRLAAITRDPFIVMSQLGHANIQTSMRYIKMAGVDVTVIEGHRITGPQPVNVTL